MAPEGAAALVLIRSTGVLPISYFRLQAASTALIRLPAAEAEGQVAGHRGQLLTQC